MRRLGTMAARSISAALPRLRLCLKPRWLPPFLNAPSDPMTEALISEKRAVDRCDAIALRHSSILLQIPVNTATLQFSCPCEHGTRQQRRRREGKLLANSLGPSLGPSFSPSLGPSFSPSFGPSLSHVRDIGKIQGDMGGFFWCSFINVQGSV